MIIIWFLILLTIIVFVHEMGHYIVARMNGVRVEVFSIGFGRELYGINDSMGTRWKICLVPLGGYVKFFGDANLSSNLPDEQLDKLSDEEIKTTFHSKNLKQKASIVFAGPFTNFIFAIIVFFGLYTIKGVPTETIILPIIDDVIKGSAAYKSGFKKNDKIIMVDNKQVNNFNDVREIIISKPNQNISFVIIRNSMEINILSKPDLIEIKDNKDQNQYIGRMGFTAQYKIIYDELGIRKSFIKSLSDTYLYTIKTFEGISEIIIGKRSASELGGPIMIASVASKAADKGIESYLFIMAIISINLGLINLFPIPLLDGGHLMLYGIQAITKSPISPIILKFQMIIGMIILFALMIFVTYNDTTKVINNYKTKQLEGTK